MVPRRSSVIAFAVTLVMFQLASACNAGPMTGTVERHIDAGGVTRKYLVHAGGEAKPGRALVLVLHGWRGGAADIERRTRGTFDRLADRDGAIVVYPSALGDPRWNDGWQRAAPAALPDDVGFLSALIEAVAREFAVDRGRVFATGISNGAGMVHRLACERPDLVAAIGPVAGGMPPDRASTCARAAGPPVSIIAMHGTGDPIAPLDQSIHDGVAAWIKRDGCPDRPSSSLLPDADPGDGTRTRADLFAPCAAGTAVAFYIIEGGGHAWPGGASTFGFRRKGITPRDFDAGVVLWDFFQSHPRR
jgi:polyhydroxybutyrate depolymerase